jgi:hypothetical protein
VSAPPTTSPTALWRVEACVPEGQWRVLCEREEDPGADAWAPEDPMPAGTCLRVVMPDGVTSGVRVVAADGSAQPLVLPDDVRRYLGVASCAAWDADPVGWWGTWPDGRDTLRLVGCAAAQGSPLHRQVVRAACACARLVLPIWEAVYPADARPRAAIETAVRWSYGEATPDDVRDAAAASSASATSAYASAAYTAYAAAYTAAYTAHVATSASAAHAATSAALAYAAASASARVLAECADLAREHIPLREVLVALAQEQRHG